MRVDSRDVFAREGFSVHSATSTRDGVRLDQHSLSVPPARQGAARDQEGAKSSAISTCPGFEWFTHEWPVSAGT